MVDYLLSNAKIINGKNEPIFLGNVGVENDKIKYVGTKNIDANKVYNLDGYYLTPGFIDIHTHTDLEIFRNPLLLKRVRQGITLDVNGNCGVGCFPNKEGSLLPLYCEDILGKVPFSWSWKDYKSFVKRVENTEMTINEAFLTPHAALRVMVMGNDCMRKATKNEIKTMCSLLSDALDEGSIGFSTGLGYVPCSFSDDDELLSLCSVVKDYNRIFTIHHRTEGDGCLLSLKSALDVAKKSGVRIEISHLKAIGMRNGSEVKKMLNLIDKYRNEGADVYFDQYPYSYGSTSLFSLLPPSILSLNRKEIQRKLKNKKDREEIKKEIENPHSWDSIYTLCGSENIEVILLESNPSFNGKTLYEIGKEMSLDPLEALFTLLSSEEGEAVMMDRTESEENLELILSHPLLSYGSDSLYSSSLLHPRSREGTLEFFRRFLSLKGNDALSECVYRLTGFNAEKLKAEEKGKIEEGMDADMCIIPLSSLSDIKLDNFISSVLVSGKVAYTNGEIKNRVGRVVSL